MSGRHRSRLYLAAAGAVVVLTSAATLVAGNGGFRARPEASPAEAQSFAAVQRTDLVVTRTLTGAVASGEGDPVINRLQGTLTAQPATGSRVERGGALYSVDGAPVTLFYGSLPAWRTLEVGVAAGPDVRQLEENLAELGFSPGSVDETFTSSTAAAVRAWQSELGLEPDGVVRLGRVVFLPGLITVWQRTTSTGAPVRDGEEVLRTRTDVRTVTVTLEADEQDMLRLGDHVTVARGGERFPATVSSMQTIEGQGGQTTVVATVTPDDPAALADVRDGASARVEIVTDTRPDVLVVPVTALLAQARGGYGVQVERDGRIVLVGVEPGLFGDGDLLEVTGDLREGDRVVVP